VGIPIVDELGSDIESTWRKADFELSGFPWLCAERLEAARLHERLAPEEIIRSVFQGDLPQQPDPLARFGQPPVTLFRSRRFYIDALFWVDGTTTIHDHGFSGAFQVLSGQSIETTFTFTTLRAIDGHLRFGNLVVQGSALRSAGDVRAVPAGAGYIHSLFHLARPSVSLVIRTFRDPDAVTQRDYSPAGIGYDAFLEDPIRDRMVQIVEMLRKTEHPALERRVGDLIADVDLNTAFAILRSCIKLSDSMLLDRLIDRVHDQEGASLIRNWIVHRRRMDFLVSRRLSVHDGALRFLLAVLLNVQRRIDALTLVAAYAPAVNPAQQIVSWLETLSRTTIRLQVGNTPFEPNVLGLPTFGPGCAEALTDLFSGRERSWTADERRFLDRLRTSPALQPLFIS
jgi:hypothetical protein